LPGKEKAMSTKKPPTLPTAPAKAPEARPPLDAVAELAVWAFALAEKSVADWPEGKRRVHAARRHLVARLRGQWIDAPCEDIAFTASLLARIFEADHNLGTSEMVAILDELGLPTDAVPIVPREPPPAAAASVEPFRRSRWKSRAPYPEPVCADCPEKRFRNAA
jgi:hypothetical protein